MTDPVEPKDEGGEPSKVQQRINQLTKGKSQEAARADAAETQVTQLSNQLVNLQATVDKISTQAAPTPQPATDPLSQLLGGNQAAPTSPAPAQNNVDIAGLIKNAVNEAMSPMMEERQQDHLAQQLQAAQTVSYQETAAMLCPQALEPGSEAQLTFDAIFKANSSLQSDPNGPGLALAAVAGILGTQGTTQKTQDARKQAASTPLPNHSPLARINDLPSSPTNKDAQKALAQKGATEGLDGDGMAALVGLALGRAKVSEE